LSTVDPDLALPYGGARIPAMLAYKNLAAANSLYKYFDSCSPTVWSLIERLINTCYSTPPTFAIYVCSVVLRSLLTSPPLPLESSSSQPLAPLSSFAEKKSSILYSLLSNDGFYVPTAEEGSWSRMNVTFRVKNGDSDLEKLFVKEASEKGLKGLGGHRSVGGAFLLSYLGRHMGKCTYCS
jgi:phosphoserine aminotransferase